MFGDITLMSKKFMIAFGVCLVLFLVFNALLLLTAGPPAKAGVSGWRSIGFPFPAKVENVQYTATGSVVTVIKNRPWVWVGNVGFWLFMSYWFSRWVDRRGAAWWRAES